MENTTVDGANSRKIWMGVAIGAAVGIGIALSRRRRSGWDAARVATKRFSNKSEDMADVSRDILERVKTIYDEGRRVVEDAGELWTHGRRLVGY
jgi:hypothetical protein